MALSGCPRNNGLSGAVDSSIIAIVKRDGEIAFSFAAALTLPFEELLKGSRPPDTALFVVKLNHAAHGLDPARALLAHNHASADIGAACWVGASYSCELVVGQGGVV